MYAKELRADGGGMRWLYAPASVILKVTEAGCHSRGQCRGSILSARRPPCLALPAWRWLDGCLRAPSLGACRTGRRSG